MLKKVKSTDSRVKVALRLSDTPLAIFFTRKVCIRVFFKEIYTPTGKMMITSITMIDILTNFLILLAPLNQRKKNKNSSISR